ncbi:MAG: protein kinase [Cyanobacteria bacterium P01_A01_bin.68]
MVSIPGYSVSEELYNGSRTQVYRAVRDDQKPVVIKLLKNPHPSFQELLQFRNQYNIAKNLNFPGIIQTYGLENYQNGYVLVMEDMGGIPLKEYFSNLNRAFLKDFLKIAVDLCDTLNILYRHRIIHKDIKPANILINPETKQVKLIDFSIASLLPKETQTLINPNVLEGTLNYISPEQTGRMNRGIDYRTDFYSLGVTFYELLTGKLPFYSDDAMELMHCHIAKVPPSINKAYPNLLDIKGKEIQEINQPHPNPLLIKEREQEVIQVLSDIVIKLMAKNAEDRYQSALGLKHDLEICLNQLQNIGYIKYFEIAQRDICDRFVIPEKLYGRENEVEQSHETYVQTNQTLQTSLSSSSISEALDFTSILKATQVLSREIQLEKLISTLLHIVIENAGAEKAALVFLKDDVLNLQAIATKDNGVQLLSIPYEKSHDIPSKVINYVKLSLETVVLNNATVKNNFISDEYLIQQKPYSLLCTPILDRGKLIGLLYLENKLTIGAFTPTRLEVINLLCTQAAISIENARLHAQEREKSYRLEESQQRLKLIIEQTPVAVIEWDTGFYFQTWNPAAEKIFGYQAHEILNKHFRCIIPEEYHAYVDDIATKILTQTGGSHAVNENITKDGRRITCEWFNAPLFNYDGEVCGGVSMTLDITDKKLAEKAITEKSQQLEKTLQELQQAQLQIVQNEKMATLGNLVAGVAHEVNNPIGFLKGSISNAEEYIQDLFAHIECYQENYPAPEEEVIESAEEIDLEFITEDLPKLLDSMKVAAERITDISNSLRTFSRADTSQKVACNIHEGIDSTILILKYRLKANDKRPAIEIIKNYGNLPLVKCFLGQLNQVFMNIIANAIDALDMTNQGKTFAEIEANPHKITIITELLTENNTVIIKIKDNGPGMPESIRERIFDNLFTTKGVGKGTGLGLAIAKQIVEETHDGKISCNSTLGQGTEFVIKLPIN